MLSDITPFKMAGNLYFVGTYAASSHLIDTGNGLILIDTGYAETADVIVNSMNILGFDIRDVKYIILSHGHRDHTGGTEKLKSLSGAKTFLNKADIKYLDENTQIDVFVKDGDIISLGNTDILCLETPGHTEGTLSFFFNLEENGQIYRAGMFGGAGTNQLKKEFLKSRNLSYLLRGDFFSSIERLKKEHVDIFIGNHSWQNNTRENYEKSLISSENPFIDSSRWTSFLEKCEQDLEKIIETESRTEFVNFAHRGATEYAPESTMLAFYLGIYMGANGIEADVQITKDGIAVLFHDPTAVRITGEECSVSDYTFDELQKFDVTLNGHTDKIIKLEDLFKYFSFRDITFAIELKQKGTAKLTADIIRKYNVQKKVVVTSFDFDELCQMRSYAPELKTGYLTDDISDNTLNKMKENGIDELCPKAPYVTCERVKYWHRHGFNVRAWGAADENLMKNAYDSGVDGMTVNFPDKLAEYIKNSS